MEDRPQEITTERERKQSVGRVSKLEIAMRVSLLAIVLNLSLSVMKFIVGTLAHSSAMLSDAVPGMAAHIAALIVWAAWQILKDAIDKMVDRAGPEELTERIDRVICQQQGVVRVDDIKTRLFAARPGSGYINSTATPPDLTQGA